MHTLVYSATSLTIYSTVLFFPTATNDTEVFRIEK